MPQLDPQADTGTAASVPLPRQTVLKEALGALQCTLAFCLLASGPKYS